MPVLFNAAIFVSKSGSLYVILRMWPNDYTLSSYMIWRVCNNTNDTKKKKTIGASWRVALNFFHLCKRQVAQKLNHTKTLGY